MDVLGKRMYGYTAIFPHVYSIYIIIYIIIYVYIYIILLYNTFSVFGHYLNVAILYRILQYHYITLKYYVVVLTEIYIVVGYCHCLSVGRSISLLVCLSIICL